MNNPVVPYIQQSKESSCGAAALSMVYRYLGKDDQTEEVIWERLKVPRPNLNGQYYLETPRMAKDAQEQGFSYFLAQAVLDSSDLALQPIREFLSLSVPVVVCQRISETNELGHFRVVTGTDKSSVTFNDPMHGSAKTTVDIDKFMFFWSRANNGEVIGGQFFAIFKKGQIKRENRFTVFTFESSIKYFNATSLEFI
ncbi:MAG: hypothetical protein A3J04_01475 [Candidatus Ryanbacteria bacterium RIFCSPLOWO2_02_FULL_47_14]|uniref:Peptidase C39 domain-containing protein n=1 Tax=Candidatus Ryanbacteria bacterium RIFCSPLOWO2_02_FULL_47_14 TaxID=1802129 RepID=A0A1G2H069_9BACT|nr:MAG: hypothetical protein A3J04_01475 [Candidatus Ryanbacteria bacterium RIFCSPLOWO2_02_FULL_47_14]